MELSEEHTHEHGDDVVEIRIPGWVLWSIAGVAIGLAVVVAWDVYTQRKRKAAKPKPFDYTAIRDNFDTKLQRLIDEETATTKVVQDEQPESPAL